MILFLLLIAILVAFPISVEAASSLRGRQNDANMIEIVNEVNDFIVYEAKAVAVGGCIRDIFQFQGVRSGLALPTNRDHEIFNERNLVANNKHKNPLTFLGRTFALQGLHFLSIYLNNCCHESINTPAFLAPGKATKK